MQMTFRWYGEGNDRIKLSDIKQIPGVKGIVWALHDKMPGEIWSEEEIAKVKAQCDEYGFNIDVVESVNVHDDIKIGLPTRDMYIENYKQTIRNLSKYGVKVICYNFMPIFDWTRSNLFHEVGDGSTALFYASFIKENFGPNRKVGFDYVGKSNVFIGNYLRLFWLYEQKEYDMVLSESVEYFYEMSKKTGTLWEHDQAKASCNHGFASVIATLLLQAILKR